MYADNCPENVQEEVGRLWADNGYGNDTTYHPWYAEQAEDYPVIAKYLSSRDIETCWIHYWW